MRLPVPITYEEFIRQYPTITGQYITKIRRHSWRNGLVEDDYGWVFLTNKTQLTDTQVQALVNEATHLING